MAAETAGRLIGYQAAYSRPDPRDCTDEDANDRRPDQHNRAAEHHRDTDQDPAENKFACLGQLGNELTGLLSYGWTNFS